MASYPEDLNLHGFIMLLNNHLMHSLCGGVFSTVVTFLNVVMFGVMLIMYSEAFHIF